jgi:CheY-like chemotaxis protein/HPt (histidine-containing phosphotransfer) domain-containing protein
LLLIVNDILDLSKIEAGSMELEIKPFSLYKAVTETVELFMPMASEKGVILSATIEKDFPGYVEGDEVRFVQILRNFLGNAVKFTDKGTVHINARWDMGFAYFIIQDSGIGIPPEQLSSIFDKFTQGNNSSTRRYGGTGLGLAISKQLVEMMHGDISVESVPEQGSTFSFHVPFKARPDLDIMVEQVSYHFDCKTSDPISLNTEARVLIAEDHPTNQFLIKRLLQKFGIQHIDLSENGREAVAFYTAQHYDLVLMDCQMPEMDGYAATRSIRQHEALGSTRIPIIAMTANAMVGDREECLKAGMDDYISKPIDAGKFAAVLTHWIPGQTHVETSSINIVKTGDLIALINLEHLQIFTDGDRDVENELFTLFFEQAQLTIERLKSCLYTEMSAEWKSASHKLKGSAANLGAEPLAALCFDAEKAYTEDKNKKEKILDSICKSIEELRLFLKNR